MAATEVGATSLGRTRVVDGEVGFSSQATGSARVIFGNTKVVCTVYGPSSSSRDMEEFSEICKIACDFKFAPFACTGERRRRGRGDDEVEFSSVVEQALFASVRTDLYPKSVLNVYVLVLEDDGNVVGAAITAASLAIAQAGIVCNDLVVASTLCLLEDGTEAVDPTSLEMENAQCSILVGYMPNLEKITAMQCSGRASNAEMAKLIDLCIERCRKLHASTRTILLEKWQRQQ